MPRWSLDELRAKLVQMQGADAPTPLAERLGVDTLRLRVEDASEDGAHLELNAGHCVAAQLTLKVHPANELRAETRAALEVLAPQGVRTDACTIFWGGSAYQKGQGFGFLLYAVGAAWAADRGLAATGGAGLLGGSTSEDSREVYRKLASLLPHVTLAPEPDPYTMGRGLLAGPSGMGYRLPEERDAFEADLQVQRDLIAFLEAVPKTKAFNVVAAERLKRLGPLSGRGTWLLEHCIYQASSLASETPPYWMTAAWVENDIEITLGTLRADLQRSEPTGLLTTVSLSPLTVLFGAPLRGVLTGRLTPRPARLR